MPPAASNKRTRATSPSPSSSQPPKSKPRTANFAPDFDKTPRSDIILESSCGAHFATSKIYLQANSQVFQDTLLVGNDDSAEKIDGLPIIKLDDSALTLQRFLSFVHHPVVEPVPVHARVSLLTPILQLDAVLEFCDKMDSPLIGRAVAARFFPILIDNIPFLPWPTSSSSP